MGSEPYIERELSFEDWKGLREVHRRVAHLPFCEQVVAYMDYWQWDATDFICETGLPSSRHSEIIHGKRKALQADSIMAICKGLRLSLRQAEDLFRAARLALSESEDEHFLYLLEANPGWSLEDSNAFLADMGQPELGGKTKQIARF